MKKQIILKILKELDEKNILLGKNDLELDDEQFGQIIETMISVGFISGVTATRAGAGSKYHLIRKYPRITLNGIEYLENNKEENSIVKAIDRLATQVMDLKYSITK
ncbi:hypothetical protein Z962_p0100 (plasmid) [Clostridium botulinum C/D str. BKT12695]|nr:hypothetical protein Z962_p0100 [Clostridium botulinum C/D str. BKT12695]